MIRCRLINFLRGLLPAEHPLQRRWVRAHRDHCSACRREYENERALANRLRAGARRGRQPAPPFLAARIRAGLRRADVPSGFGRAARPRWFGLSAGAWVTATAAVPLLIIGRIWLAALLFPPGTVPLPGGADAAAVEFTRQQTTALLERVETLPTDRAFELAGELDAPLQRELDALFSDARQAFQVVQSCLPTEPVRVLADAPR